MAPTETATPTAPVGFGITGWMRAGLDKPGAWTGATGLAAYDGLICRLAARLAA